MKLAREAAEDKAAIREMQTEIRQIWEYLFSQLFEKLFICPQMNADERR